MMVPPTEKTGPMEALHVLRRLVREGRASLSAGLGALASIVGETVIDTAVIPALIALVFLTLMPPTATPSSPRSVASSSTAAGQVQAAVNPASRSGQGLKSDAQQEIQAQASKSRELLKKIGWEVGDNIASRLRALRNFIFLMLLAWALKCAFAFGRGYLAELFAQRLVRNLRQRLYEHLIRQSLSFHKARSTGDILSRVSNDVSVLHRVLSSDLVSAVSAPITILIALGMMTYFSPPLTALALVCMPGIGLIIARSGHRLRRLAREVQRRLGTLNSYLQERLSGVETVQIFGMEQEEITRFNDINRSNFRANMRVAWVMALLSPVVEFVSMAGMLLLIYIAGYLAIKGQLEVGELLAFAYVSQRLGSKLGLMGKIWLSAQQAAAAGDRVFEVLDAKEDVPEIAGAPALSRVRGEITFHQVEFRYVAGDDVLRGVNTVLQAGQSVALVGASGAGKTSLVNLIPRFYEPSAGHIEIDGVDIATVSLRSLRSQIGIVPQDPILFSGSARENIAYGRPEATGDEIEAAARAAHAAEFIRDLPEGYDTPVGERATKLSGGQKQRLAIARTLLRDPRILILDEATSALDAESEALVQDAMERLMQGRTTIIIAHRLSTIQRVDRILVLADGVIAEDGANEQLLRNGGLYRRLYETQLQGLNGEGQQPS